VCGDRYECVEDTAVWTAYAAAGSLVSKLGKAAAALQRPAELNISAAGPEGCTTIKMSQQVHI
jgi:hypothetical protein